MCHHVYFRFGYNFEIDICGLWFTVWQACNKQVDRCDGIVCGGASSCINGAYVEPITISITSTAATTTTATTSTATNSYDWIASLAYKNVEITKSQRRPRKRITPLTFVAHVL